MLVDSRKVSRRGRSVRVPAVEVDGLVLVVTGRFLRLASVYDADFADRDTTLDPVSVRKALSSAGVKADILTFSQRPGESEPRYPYRFEWDNAAVACAGDHGTWWNSLPQEARKNVRRAGRRGVTVDVAAFGDDLVRGIKALYDETPLRQGRRFWHYGKSLETVRAENSSYLDRSEFVGAYYEGTLIGFMKFVYAGRLAVIMQILASPAHQDKRPMNAMIAKAMEVCHGRGTTYLVYGKFRYGNKGDDAIVEFKRRNGFTETRFPKYFVPLTFRGRVALALGMHRGAIGLLPAGAIEVLLNVRAAGLRLHASLRPTPHTSDTLEQRRRNVV